MPERHRRTFENMPHQTPMRPRTVRRFRLEGGTKRKFERRAIAVAHRTAREAAPA